MKVKYTSKDKKFQTDFDVSTEKELFKQLARFQEVFEINTCGKCKKDNVRFNVRTVDSNDYYELICRDCGYQFSFGQNKTGNTLFPKNTWSKWTPEGKE